MLKKSTRISALIATTALASLTVTACGTNSSNASPQNNSSVSGTQLAASTKPQFPITLTDDTHHKVTVMAQPMHVVSGTEGTDEMIASLLPKSRIALVTNISSNPLYSDVTGLVKGLPQWTGDNPEKALSVQPDLVLMASYGPQKVMTQIKNAGIPVYEFNDFTSISSIEHNIGVVGKLVGETGKAHALVANMKHNLGQIKHEVKGQKRPTVLDYSSYGFAGGKATIVDDIIKAAGGVNAAAKLNGWAKITDEEIVKMNPDVIIDSSDDKGFLKKLAKEPGLQSVKAVKEHHLYTIKSSDLSSVSQFVAKAVYDVAKVLHPSAHLKTIQVMQ